MLLNIKERSRYTKKFIEQIIEVIDLFHYKVKFLRNKENRYYWPETDIDVIDFDKIIGSLKEPSIQRRGQLHFRESF